MMGKNHKLFPPSMSEVLETQCVDMEDPLTWTLLSVKIQKNAEFNRASTQVPTI
jgi:hypothetical protein